MMQQQIQELYERNERKIKQRAVREEEDLKRTYKNLPDLTHKVAEQSEIAPERLVSIVSFAAALYNLEWYQVLRVLDTFYTYKDDLILPK